MWHFARGLAFADKGKADDAAKELTDLQGIRNAIPTDQPFGNNTAANVLKVPNDILTAVVAGAHGDKEKLSTNSNKPSPPKTP